MPGLIKARICTMAGLALLTGLLTGLLAPLAANAQVYRCETNGNVTFTDQPCPDDSAPITIRDNRIGGQFNQNLPAQPPADDQPGDEPDADTSPEPEADTCRFINSTELRTYLVREQVVRGMTRNHVRRAFGNPPETYTSPVEVWIYQTRYYGALYELTYVYFKDGCVDRVEYRKP